MVINIIQYIPSNVAYYYYYYYYYYLPASVYMGLSYLQKDMFIQTNNPIDKEEKEKRKECSLSMHPCTPLRYEPVPFEPHSGV